MTRASAARIEKRKGPHRRGRHIIVPKRTGLRSPLTSPLYPQGGGGGGGSSAVAATIYDGVGDYLKHTGGPAGAADGAELTAVWAGTFNSDGSTMTLVDIPGTVPVQLVRQSDNTIDFIGGVAGAVFSNSTTAVAASLGFLIILASCNGTSSTLKVVHAAGTITGTNTPGAATNLDLTADWFLGSNGGASEFLDADTSMWWLNNAEINFGAADNIEQFWDTTLDMLRDPGSDGSNPVDAAYVPLICHVNPAASHTVNRGDGGDADDATTFEDGTSPGTYSPDFVPDTPASIAYVASSAKTDITAQTTYSWSAVPIGTATATRIVAVSFHAETSAGITVDSATIGGSAATIAVQVQNGTASIAAVLYLLVTSGTTADIAVTLSAAAARAAITVHEVNTLTGTPSDTDTDTGTHAASLPALTIPTDGVALCATTSATFNAFAWTNADETTDDRIDFSAEYSTATRETAGTTTISNTGSGFFALVGAAWGP